MLTELRTILLKLAITTTHNSQALSWLCEQYTYFMGDVCAIKYCQFPHVQRIRLEEAFEKVDIILYCPFRGNMQDVRETTIWYNYCKEIESNCILDFSYMRYQKAKRGIAAQLKASYLDGLDGPDYKSKRYAYALSTEHLPEWFNPTKLLSLLEEAVTAYCFLIISICDYLLEIDTLFDDENKGDDTMCPEAGYTSNPEYSQQTLKALSMINQSLENLMRPTLTQSLAAKTEAWVKGDPELEEIILSGKKTLEKCIRYVMEQTIRVANSKIEAMTSSEISNLPQQEIHGKNAHMLGLALEDEQIFTWAREYYYNPKVEPKNIGSSKSTSKKKATKGKNDNKASSPKKESKPDGAAKKGDSKKNTPTSPSAPTPESFEQLDFFSKNAA